MTKSERKSEKALAQQAAAHLAKQEQQGNDESFHRTLLLILLVVLLTFIIVPKGVLTPTEFSPGDIVPRDIKASRDILIPDDELSEQKRHDAAKAVANLYDYDPATGAVVSEQADQILASLRVGIDLEMTEDEQISELESSFGVKTNKENFCGTKGAFRA